MFTDPFNPHCFLLRASFAHTVTGVLSGTTHRFVITEFLRENLLQIILFGLKWTVSVFLRDAIKIAQIYMCDHLNMQ